MFDSWSFNLCNKRGKIPEFITNSDKTIQVYLKEVGFNNIPKIVNFVKNYGPFLKKMLIHEGDQKIDFEKLIFQKKCLLKNSVRNFTFVGLFKLFCF